MKMVIEISETLKKIADEEDIKTFSHFIWLTIVMDAIKNGTPLPEHLNKIKDDIGKYELDCRFADVSQTDECTICNKNVFGSIYRIIDKYTEESENE